MENVCIPSGLLPRPWDAKLILPQDQKCISAELEHSTKACSHWLKSQKPLFFPPLFDPWTLKSPYCTACDPQTCEDYCLVPICVTSTSFCCIGLQIHKTIWDSVFAQYLLLLSNFSALVNTERTSDINTAINSLL